MNLIEKVLKNSTLKHSSLLSESILFNEKDSITTNIPALNIALSGKVDGGFIPSVTIWAGESKRFKSLFSLVMVKSYLTKYPDAIVLFYDSEFGTPKSYFESLKLPKNQILHCPVTNIEQLKFDLVKQLNEFNRGDKVIIVVDSLGNLASKKEVEDAIVEKAVADMSRAKSIKSIFRMITPILTLKDIPLIVVNHVYKEQGTMYPKDIVSGGTGPTYSADNIYIIGRQQEKEGTELTGYSFVINVEKSRFVKEKSKIPISVSFEDGINKWSGLLEIALDLGFVTKPSQGWYAKVNSITGEIEDKKYRAKDTNSKEFWTSIIESEEFKTAVFNKFGLSSHSIINEEDIEDIFEKEEV